MLLFIKYIKYTPRLLGWMAEWYSASIFNFYLMKDNLFLNHLNSLYHESDIFSDNKTTDFYSKDWSSVQHTLPKAVVFPKTKEQIIETVNLCNKYNVPFIGSGGRTGIIRRSYCNK